MTALMMFMLLATVAEVRTEELFQAAPVPVVGFTAGIEGPACDKAGNLYTVAYRQPENIARITPEGKAEVFVTFPNKNRAGRMFVAD